MASCCRLKQASAMQCMLPSTFSHCHCMQTCPYEALGPEERLAVLQGLMTLAGESAAVRATMPDAANTAGGSTRRLPLGIDGMGTRYFALAPESCKLWADFMALPVTAARSRWRAHMRYSVECMNIQPGLLPTLSISRWPSICISLIARKRSWVNLMRHAINAWGTTLVMALICRCWMHLCGVP